MDSTNSWTGPCNQLDIYTTLLDLYGIETDWRGLGHTLYTRDYKNSVSERTQELSEWIIRGNYWKSRIAE
jgi:lipoteichoic acid synthase